jgi:hypothetical protein
LETQRRSFAVAAYSGDSWNNFKKDYFNEPQDLSSILGLWARQGGEKFQRPVTRLGDMGRLKGLFQSLDGLLPLAIFRAKLNPVASVPLSVLPNKPERKFTNVQFQYCLCDRLQATQPSVASTGISLLRGNWKGKCVLGDSNGRHLRKCSKGNSKTIFHDTMCDFLPPHSDVRFRRPVRP